MKKDLILSACLFTLMLAGCASRNGADGVSSVSTITGMPEGVVGKQFCQVATEQSDKSYNVYNTSECLHLADETVAYRYEVSQPVRAGGSQVTASAFSEATWLHKDGVLLFKDASGKVLNTFKVERVALSSNAIIGSVLFNGLKSTETLCLKLTSTDGYKVSTICSVDLYAMLNPNELVPYSTWLEKQMPVQIASDDSSAQAQKNFFERFDKKRREEASKQIPGHAIPMAE